MCDAGALVGLGMRGVICVLRLVAASGCVSIALGMLVSALHQLTPICIKGGYPTVHIERDSAINYSRSFNNTANDGGAIDGISDGTGRHVFYI